MWLQVHTEYDDFAAQHSRHHAGDQDYYGRRALFLHHHTMIKQHNLAAKKPYRLALNKFADWTDGEYRRLLGHKGSTHQALRKGSEKGSHRKVFKYDIGSPLVYIP
jgi:hypothetical protein